MSRLQRCKRLRSLLVSLVTTSFEVIAFLVCTLMLAGVALIGARWVCGAIGAAVNFVLNRVWAFRAARVDRTRGQALRYGATALVSVTLATALLWGLTLLPTGLDVRLLHVASMGLVWMVFTFPVLRGWVFAPRRALT